MQCGDGDVRWERPERDGGVMHSSMSSLPPIHDAGSVLPRLLPPTARIATPPPPLSSDALAHSRSRSRLPAPQQRAPAPLTSLLKFPSLVKPQHRIAPLVGSSKCNQEDESVSRSSNKAQQHGSGNNDDSAIVHDGDDADDDNDERISHDRSGRSWGISSSSAAAGGSGRPAVADKNRDFIRELEEKKRKEREDEARKQRRKQKLHAKLSKKILEEAAQARQKQESEPEQPDGDAAQESASVGGDAAGGGEQPPDDERESEDARQRRREKAKHQKRLLKKQQALLEQLQTKQKEKQEEAELERERERRRQLKVKRAVLTAIYDANARCEEDADEDEVEDADCIDSSGEPAEHSTSELPLPPVRPAPSGPPLAAAASAAGSAAATLLRERRDALAAAAADDATDEQQRQRSKDAASAIQRKQHEYLAKLAEQRKQKAKDEEDARALQEKRKKRIQQEALLRHQEVARQQQEAAAAAAAAAAVQREKDESAERAAPAVDVDAMVARLSKLKDRDAQVVPEARDFASWKKRHGVRADQSVFCVTGCYPVIREELERRGWFFNAEKVSPFFDLKWSLKSDDLKAFKLEKHQYVNHFFQNTAITTKVGLLHNLRNIVWHQSLDIDTIFPRAYDLNESRDMETFVQDFRYGVAEGLLKELAKICLERTAKTCAVRANIGVVDVLLAVARKKVRSKRPDSDNDDCMAANSAVDLLEESLDNLAAPGALELVTDLEWEVLSKCDVDKPGSLRASLMYKKKLFTDDRADAALGVEGGGAAQANAPSVDTVLSALEKKQQRQLEKQRAEAFAREKARLALLLSKVEAIDESALQEVVRLARALEALCPQFRINGGWQLPRSPSQTQSAATPEPPVPHVDMLSSKSLNIWIVKPAGMSRGRGIRVFNNLELLLEYADVENHKECQWVAQKYIENPLLVCRRKFDIRQWVLVTSWDPLTVWFHRDCYLRFSSEEYSLDDLSDQYVHLTNNSIQKYSDKFHDVYATADGAIAVEGNMLHSDDFKRYLASALGKPASFWDAELQRRMKDIVVGSLQCVQDMVQHRANCCELFGYDFMIDTDLTPWLIEVNSSPACDYSTPTAERYVKSGLADIIKVIVDHREFEQKKKSGGAGAGEPDTGCWQRIHKGEFIGKPVSSFGADFFVKGAKVQKAKRGGASTRAPPAASAVSSSTGASAITTSSSTCISSSSNSAAPVGSDRGGFVVVEEDDGEEEVEDLQQDGDTGDNDNDDNTATRKEAAADELASQGEEEEEDGEPDGQARVAVGAISESDHEQDGGDDGSDGDVDPIL